MFGRRVFFVCVRACVVVVFFFPFAFFFFRVFFFVFSSFVSSQIFFDLTKDLTNTTQNTNKMNPIAPSYLNNKSPSKTREKIKERNFSKLNNVKGSVLFPIVFESTGAYGDITRKFFQILKIILDRSYNNYLSQELNNYQLNYTINTLKTEIMYAIMEQHGKACLKMRCTINAKYPTLGWNPSVIQHFPWTDLLPFFIKEQPIHYQQLDINLRTNLLSTKNDSNISKNNPSPSKKITKLSPTPIHHPENK